MRQAAWPGRLHLCAPGVDFWPEFFFLVLQYLAVLAVFMFIRLQVWFIPTQSGNCSFCLRRRRPNLKFLGPVAFLILVYFGSHMLKVETRPRKHAFCTSDMLDVSDKTHVLLFRRSSGTVKTYTWQSLPPHTVTASYSEELTTVSILILDHQMPGLLGACKSAQMADSVTLGSWGVWNQEKRTPALH